jgi:murein DD-endopeptidase MepM/ murein hydrolase activator NlpD
VNSYPICLFGEKIFPIFGQKFSGKPLYFPLDDSSDVLQTQKQKSGQADFQLAIEDLLKKNNAEWAVSGYPEKRSLVADYTEEVRKSRHYHIGIDVTAPLGTRLYAPLAAEVVTAEYEEGAGQFGGYIVLKHEINDCVFYTVFGHLNPSSLPGVGTKLKAGDPFGQLGDMGQNGGWFYHTHLQVLTERGFNQGWKDKALCTKEQLGSIHEFCPNPLFLIL